MNMEIEVNGLTKSGTELLWEAKINAVLLAEMGDKDDKKQEVILSVYISKGRDFRKRVWISVEDIKYGIATANGLMSVLKYYVEYVKEKI